jgi:hypothetical protein
MTFRIVGRVVDADTGDGIGGLLVEGWDADLVFDDLVGSAPTDATGGFFMEFDEGYFRELFFDRKPDLYFEIHHRGRVVYTTKGVVEWNLDIGETWIVIELERHLLGDGHDPHRPTYPDSRQHPDLPPVDSVHPGPRVHLPDPGDGRTRSASGGPGDSASTPTIGPFTRRPARFPGPSWAARATSVRRSRRWR